MDSCGVILYHTTSIRNCTRLMCEYSSYHREGMELITHIACFRNYSNRFGSDDFGYLVLLYLYLILVRFVMVFVFYPLTKRIGLGTNKKEAVFMGFAGFRGAVGIALSLSLWANVMAGKLVIFSNFMLHHYLCDTFVLHFYNVWFQSN